MLDLTQLADLPREFTPTHQAARLRRSMPPEAEPYFAEVAASSFSVECLVTRNDARADVKRLVKEVLLPRHTATPFFDRWVDDMAQVCEVFCRTLETEATSFFLGTKRGCRRYHVDNVPQRLLVTYFGTGTEWIPNEGADREAYRRGLPNEHILTDPRSTQWMSAWDVAVFRGEPDGLLHRTPDAALTGRSILMRLDHPSVHVH